MHRKRLVLLSGVALVALLLVGLVGVTAVSAQEPTPESEVPFGWRGGGRGWGGFGRGMFGGVHGGQWTMFDAAAEALGLTPEELFAELHAGKTLDEIAEAQGVEMEAVQDALDAARGQAMQQAIEQAVEDGRITQEQADWMLEGLEQGFFPMGRGFGRGRGWGRCSCPETQ
jgi:hypothetical protein